jgi:CRISPR-associated protein Cmr1
VSDVEYVRLKLTLETPFLPGSADPNVVDPDWPLRPSEVKGVWRWWARAFVGGILYEKGLLVGQRDDKRGYLKVPRDNEVALISEIVGEKLGLGYVAGSKSRASYFKISISPSLNIEKYISKFILCQDSKVFTHKLQRIQLLMMTKSIDVKESNIASDNTVPRGVLKISRDILRDLGVEYIDKLVFRVDGKINKKNERRCRVFNTEIIDNAVGNKKVIMINPSDLKQLQDGLRRPKYKLSIYKEMEYLERGINFDLKISYNRERGNLGNDEIVASLSILLLALTLSCFGKGSRRGLGCFKINSLEVNDDKIRSDVMDMYNAIRQGEINKAIRKVRERLENVMNPYLKGNITGEPKELPPMPVISSRIFYQSSISDMSQYNFQLSPYMLCRITLKDSKVDTDYFLNILHNFFLRPVRANTLHKAQDRLRQELKAWILGLPREQRGTGYKIIGSASRRASPMLLAVHGNEAYLSVFVSADWPNKLEWYRAGSKQPKPLQIDEKEVINATAIALSEFMEYLKEKKINIQVDRVWP